MSDIFGIAKSGLQAYKEGLATTGQNIANVGNESYARRDAPISEVKSSADVLQIANTAGYGVKIDGITRAFDKFIDLTRFVKRAHALSSKHSGFIDLSTTVKFFWLS